MSTRRAKQLIYGALYLLIVLVVCGLAYLVFVLPSTLKPVVLCTPSTCAPTSTAPILMGPTQMFVTSPGHYSFVAQATDRSSDYGSAALDYALDLDDASGTVLQSIPERTFIYPTQGRYLMVLNQAIAQPFDHAALVVTGVSWLASSTIGPIPAVAPGQFALQNIQTGVASATVSVGGQLVNTGVVSFEQVFVVVTFDDSMGNPIGVSQTELDNVRAGTTNSFSVIYPNIPNINPALNQIIVYALR